MHFNSRTGSLAVVTVVLMALMLPGCRAREPKVKTSEAASVPDEEQQRISEQAETRQRNRNSPAFTAEELNTLMAEPMHKAHLKLWNDLRSFYALQEVAEGIIEPELGRIRRQDIQKLLGKGNPDYPNSNGRILEYAGERQIPQGSHLLIYFDGNDVAEHTDWVSE